MTFRPVCSQKRRSAGGGLLADDAVPGQDDGPLARLEELGRPVELGGDRLDERRGAARHGRALDLGLHHVVGQLEVGGAGLLALGDGEGLAHRLRDDLRVVDARVPLRHRLHHPHDVDVLVALLVHLGEARLAGERDDRRAVQVGVGQAGDEVGRAGPERAETDAGPAGEAAVGVGHEGRPLLVPDGEEGDGLGVLDRLVQVERLLAGDPEDVPDALVLEAADEELCGRRHTASLVTRSVADAARSRRDHGLVP